MHFSTLLATAYAFTAVSGHFMKRQVEAGLIPLLSSNASIYYPTDSGFTVSSERFTELNRPDFHLIVHVASEDDVVATVCPIPLEDLFFVFLFSSVSDCLLSYRCNSQQQITLLSLLRAAVTAYLRPCLVSAMLS